MKNLLVMLILNLLCASSFAYAGSADVAIECVSPSGKTHISAVVPGDDEDAAVKVTVEDKTLSFVNEMLTTEATMNNQDLNANWPNNSLASITTIDRTDLKVYVISAVTGKYDEVQFQLVAKPDTFSGSTDGYGARHYKFKAALTTRNPAAPTTFLQNEVSCTYSYSI